MEIVGFLVFLPLSALISRSVSEFCLSAASVPGRCRVLSNCATTAQQERRQGQTHPGEVAWPIMSWRIRGRLLVSQPARGEVGALPVFPFLGIVLPIDQYLSLGGLLA